MGNYDGSVKIDSKLDLDGLKKAVGELKQVISDAVSDIKPKLEEINEAAKNTGQEAASGARAAKEGFADLGQGAEQAAQKVRTAASAFNMDAAREQLQLLEGQLAQTNEKIEAQRAVVKQLEKELRVAKFSDIGVENAEKKLDAANRALEGLYQAAGNCYEEIDRLHEQMGDAADAADTMAESTDQAAEKTGKLADAAAESAEKVGKTGDALDQMGEKSEKAGSSAEGAGKKAKKSGDDAKSASEGFNTMTVALGNLIARGIEKLIASLAKLIENTQEARQNMAKLKVSAEEAGESMEHVEDSLRKLQGVSSESKDNIEALANLLQADFKGETLDTVVENLAGAVVRFPETLKIESLADSLQETVATGKGVGQFAELLERCGVDIDSFNARMEAAGSTAARQNIVMQTLANTGLAESYRAYSDNNRALVEAGEASYDYQQAMNDLAETLEPVKFAAMDKITEFIQENGDVLERWGTVLLAIVNVILAVLEVLAQIPPEVIVIIGVAVMVIAVINAVSKAIGTVQRLTGDFVNGSMDTVTKINMIIIAVTALAVAIALVVYMLVALKESSEAAGQMMDGFNAKAKNVTSNVNAAKSQGKQNGFARGTASAPRGRFLVGENGPEEIELRGGERIYSATQSRARRALATGGGSGGVVNNYYNLDVSKVRSMAQVVELAESAQQYNRKYGR